MTRLVSLGSSFAAGPGVQPQVLPSAGRSGANYAHRLADQLGAELVDLSVSGATLLNISSEPQVFRGTTFAPQIDGLPEDADLVLVLGGGNDMSYIGGLIFASLEASWVGWMAMKVVSWMGLTPSPAGFEETVKRYITVLDAIHTKAPKAHVVVVEYLTLLGSDVKPGLDVPFGEQEIEKHRATASLLQEATAAAVSARSSWCQLVPIAELSRQHGLGSEQPWVFGYGIRALWRKETWYHPNASGMEAVAKILAERIKDRK